MKKVILLLILSNILYGNISANFREYTIESLSEIVTNSKSIKIISKVLDSKSAKIISKIAPIVGSVFMIKDVYEIMTETDPSSLIAKNKKFIERIQEEEKILGSKISQNVKDINKNFHNILGINKNIILISSQISSLNQIVSKNKKLIKNIENGILITAINQLNNDICKKRGKRSF